LKLYVATTFNAVNTAKETLRKIRGEDIGIIVIDPDKRNVSFGS